MTTDTPNPTTPPGHHDTLAGLMVPVGQLQHYPGNARVHNLPVLAEFLKVNGQYRPIVANRRTGQVLAGNGTLAAAVELGWSEIAVTWVDVDDEAARRIVLVDNRANDLAGYDDGLLAGLLKAAQPDLSGTGFDQAAFDALVASLWVPAGLTDPDAVPPVPAVPRTTGGDVWVLGPHRLVCADATDPGAYGAVCGSERPGCMWTDPPYGVGYVGKTKDALKIRGDGKGGLPALLSAGFAAASTALEPGAAVYVAHPAGVLSLTFARAFVDAGWRLHETLAWVKDQMVLGHADYHYRHEPILYGYTGGAKGRRGRGGAGWYGDHKQTTVLEVDRPKASAVHPTMKPTELIVRCINNSCRPGGTVLDPFGGSGSTLIAAHLTGRQARLIELDPGYCDVICRRWQEHTGVKPVLEATGEPHDFTEEVDGGEE